MPDSAYIYEIEDVVAAVNRKTGWKVQLHAFWNYPIWRDSCAGFKLHDKFRDPLRVMHLSVPAREFANRQLTPAAIDRISGEIESFFGTVDHNRMESGEYPARVRS